MTHPLPVLWFRRDLRLQDHDALHGACPGSELLSLFILPGEEVGAASKAWLHHSLIALQGALAKKGSQLIVMEGPPEKAFEQLAAEFGTLAVYTQKSSDPLVARTSWKASCFLGENGHGFEEDGDPWLDPPASVHNLQGATYKVFTPFWRNLRGRLMLPVALPAPDALPPTPELALAMALPASKWGLAPTIPWDLGFWNKWQPGEEGAQEALSLFTQGSLACYSDGRDRPGQAGTSNLSAHLTWGEISIHEVASTILSLSNTKLAPQVEKYLSELGWREFARHLFHAYPKLDTEDFSNQGLAWEALDERLAHAWQTGNTGIPMVDAGMRELWQTGYMHNRVRMIVADYWCKHFGFDWRAGAAWFWDTLVDADLASNSIGWQWAGGTGPDAAPYYRIFNPVLQGQRFDQKGLYRTQYLPELASLTGKALDLPGPINGYPAALVDLKSSRARALSAWSNREVG